MSLLAKSVPDYGTVHLSRSVYTDSKAGSGVTSLSPSDKPTQHCTKVDNQVRKLSNKGRGARKK